MQNNITLKDRLTQFLEYLDIGQAKFAKVAGLSKGFANNVGDSIRTDNLRKISDAYPQLNILWLTAGVGQMLNTDSQQSDEQCECPISSITDSIAKIAESVAIIAKGNMELIKQHGILIEMLNNKK